MATQLQALSAAINDFDEGGISLAVTSKAKLCLIDFLGCAFEAIDLPPSRQARAVANPGTTAHIVGCEHTTTPQDAAFANAVMGHGLVIEDMHAASIVHHGVVVWPALMALSEGRHIPGQRFLAAAILAYEVGCRLGRQLVDANVARLYRPTGLVGPIGSAAGGSWMLRLGPERTVSALALAANTSSGLNQWPLTGGADMYFHPGFAARNALTAIGLAEAGAFGSPDILEGEAGLFAAFGRRAMAGPITLFPAGKADILNVYHKPAPACNFAQTACQSALRLVGGLGPDAPPVRSVQIEVPLAAATYPGCDRKGPFERSLQAKMSIPFGVAAVLVHRRLNEANYRDIDNPEVLQLAAATELTVSDELTAQFPRFQGARVQVVLADGRRISTALQDVVPATEAQVRHRFRESASNVLTPERADAIEAFIDEIELVADVGRLSILCSKSRN